MIPGYSEEVKFRTWEELRNFVEIEPDAWAWIGESNWPQQPKPIGQVASHYINALNNLRNWIGVDTVPSNFEQHRGEIESALSMYNNGNLLCSKSADGQFIVSLAQEDPGAALGALATLANEDWPLEQRAWRNVLRGATQLAASRVDKNGAVARATKALDDLRNDWTTRLDNEISALEELRAEVRKEHDTTKVNIKVAQERVSKFWIDRGNKARSFFQKARSDKKTIERTFTEHMRLEAPAKYWRDKSLGHQGWAVLAFGGFAVIALFAVVVLLNHAQALISNLYSRERRPGLGTRHRLFRHGQD